MPVNRPPCFSPQRGMSQDRWKHLRRRYPRRASSSGYTSTPDPLFDGFRVLSLENCSLRLSPALNASPRRSSPATQAGPLAETPSRLPHSSTQRPRYDFRKNSQQKAAAICRRRRWHLGSTENRHLYPRDTSIDDPDTAQPPKLTSLHYPFPRLSTTSSSINEFFRDIPCTLWRLLDSACCLSSRNCTRFDIDNFVDVLSYL
ncbi:hypothetical protein F5I97DRAFT_1076663 [Phlebopus sp. FC_14]|nr:hypothetical protein F5I97DRAFT_1076663 [Phlebopus sp. FC_14]